MRRYDTLRGLDKVTMKELLRLRDEVDKLVRKEIGHQERNTDRLEEICEADRTGGARSSALLFGSFINCSG